MAPAGVYYFSQSPTIDLGSILICASVLVPLILLWQAGDRLCRQIMEEQIISRFKVGRFSDGILAGVQALDLMVREKQRLDSSATNRSKRSMTRSRIRKLRPLRRSFPLSQLPRAMRLVDGRQAFLRQ